MHMKHDFQPQNEWTRRSNRGASKIRGKAIPVGSGKPDHGHDHESYMMEGTRYPESKYTQIPTQHVDRHEKVL